MNNFFFALITLVTVFSIGQSFTSMGDVWKISSKQSDSHKSEFYKPYGTKAYTKKAVQNAPVVIGVNGELSFPGRKPIPAVCYALRKSIENGNVEAVNEILAKHSLYIIPSSNDNLVIK